MPFRPSPLALALLLSFASVAPLHAAEAPARTYHIAPMPLESALNQFGRDSGVLISFGSQVTQGLQSHGLSGDFTPAQGLAALLEGTGLQATPPAPRSSWAPPAWSATGLATPSRTTSSNTPARGT